MKTALMVFASDLVAGRLSLVASWPEPSTLFVSVGGGPYLVDTRDPDRWSRIDRRARWGNFPEASSPPRTTSAWTP